MQNKTRKQNITTLHVTALFAERGSHFLQDRTSDVKLKFHHHVQKNYDLNFANIRRTTGTITNQKSIFILPYTPMSPSLYDPSYSSGQKYVFTSSFCHACFMTHYPLRIQWRVTLGGAFHSIRSSIVHKYTRYFAVFQVGFP
jgi:hypothetical protein